MQEPNLTSLIYTVNSLQIIAKRTARKSVNWQMKDAKNFSVYHLSYLWVSSPSVFILWCVGCRGRHALLFRGLVYRSMSMCCLSASNYRSGDPDALGSPYPSPSESEYQTLKSGLAISSTPSQSWSIPSSAISVAPGCMLASVSSQSVLFET